MNDTRRSPLVGRGWRTLLLFALSVLAVGGAPVAQAALSTDPQAWLGKAERKAKHGWVYVHVEGGPEARGWQHGYLLASEIRATLRATRVCWEYQSGMAWAWLIEQGKVLLMPKVDVELLAEIDGMVAGLRAAGVATSREELITYNGIIELAGYWWPQRRASLGEAATPAPRQSCSAFIATGRMTKDGGVVLGHNTMFDYPQARANVVLDLLPERGHRILMQINPGWVHSGTDFFLTDAGLVGAETTIGGFDGFDEAGIPEFVRMRRATQDAGSIDEWCEAMKRGNNGGYANAWLLGDVRSGEIARLELGLKHVALEKTRDGYFVGSNVAEDGQILRFETELNELDIRLSSIARRVRWEALMSKHAGAIDARLAQRFEADHYDAYLRKHQPGSRSLCGHFELDAAPWGGWPGAPFYPAGTFDAKVVDARMGRELSFAARWGSACGRPFDAAKFLKAHPQFGWMRDILESRPSEPWTTFRAGER
jgi:hypothetical protein